MIGFIEKETACGEIRGIENENTLEFRGIKYANANRWEYPTAISSWNGVYDATEFGACSYQQRGFEEDEKCNAFYHNEFRRNQTFTYSEDCQFLNIITPKNAEKCPVLIYIHGGSFTGGSADEQHLQGDIFAENGIVFVSFNYRLGPFGFCSHPDLADENGTCGNYGLFDQQTAIKWVYDHIDDFGGDNERITLMGQSAGAMSVDIHLSSPLTNGMINGAILCSGGALQRGLIKPLSPKSTVKYWEIIMQNANVSSMEGLRKADPKVLYYAWYRAYKSSMMSMPYTLPVYDGRLLCKNSFTMKSIPNIPYMIGMTITDMLPPILESLTKRWARSTDNTYTYIFSRLLPGDNKGAWHACDLLYWFKTLKNNWRPFEAVDYKIADEMSQSIIAFVKNGNPNCDAVPTWQKGFKVTMTFCENTEMKKWDTKTIIKNFPKGMSV